MIEPERYYRVLDLEPGASSEEVHQGYLDLIWVWHPDRFTGHPRLQKKAHYKLQELNEAHDQLRSFQPNPQPKDLRTKSKSQVSSPPHDQAPAESLYKSDVQRAWGREEKTSSKACQQRVSANTRTFDEWLD